MQPFEHPLEELESLFLELDDGVTARVAAEADALLDVVHAVQVLHPVVVDAVQDDQAFYLPHRLGAE